MPGEFQIQQRVACAGRGLVGAGDVERGVADLYGGVLNLAGTVLQAMRVGESDFDRLGRSGRALAKLQIVEVNGAARGERLPVGRGVHVNIGDERDAGIRGEESVCDGVKAGRGDLRVGGAGCGVSAIDGADFAGDADRASCGQVCFQLKRKLRSEGKIARRESDVVVDARLAVRGQGCDGSAAVLDDDAVNGERERRSRAL